MGKTKSTPSDTPPSRRGVLALLGGLVLTPLAAPGTADAKPEGHDFVIRDGWILRPDDIARISVA